MATKLSKPVTREIVMKNINGVEGDVAVTMSTSGVSFAKGKRKLPVISWKEISKLIVLPNNVPAKYNGDPINYLVELTMNKNDRATSPPARVEEEAKLTPILDSEVVPINNNLDQISVDSI